MGWLRLYQPTKVKSTFYTELASNATVLALLPFILHISIPWPSTLLEKVAALIFLGVFGVLHVFFKMATFYAAHQGELTHRRGAMGYMGTSFLMLLFLLFFQGRWVASLEAARVQAQEETVAMALGSMYAQARILPEGASLSTESTPALGQTISTRWANVNGGQLEKIYATFMMEGKTNTLYETSLTLPAQGWGEIRVPNEFLPDELRRCEVRWTRKKEPNWQRILGLRPIVFAPQVSPGEETPPAHEVAVSGPYVHFERPVKSKPNIVLILIDGLAANHLSLFGYVRDVTPSIDKLGYTGLSFPNTIVSENDINQSIGQLFTGNRSGTDLTNGTSASIVSALQQAGYSTIAFTEGDVGPSKDLFYYSGAETGFELFNAHYDATTGSKQTLTDAQQWIHQHQAIPFFMMLRLRGLENAPSTQSDTKGTYPESGTARPVDRFDNALSDLDSQIGSLLKYIRDHDIRKNTYILITSPYGHDFSLQRSGQLLSEPTMRVPFILHGPGLRTGQVPRQVSMADIGVTISDVTGVPYPKLVDGQSVL